MKPKRKQKITTSQTEMKLRSGVGLTRHLISGVLCFAVISLICSSASAQNLFVSDFDSQGNYGIIFDFTPNGVRSTFASGLNTLLAWRLTSPVICLWRMRGAAPSINLLRMECEPLLFRATR